LSPAAERVPLEQRRGEKKTSHSRKGHKKDTLDRTDLKIRRRQKAFLSAREFSGTREGGKVSVKSSAGESTNESGDANAK